MLQNLIKVVTGNNYYKLTRTANYAIKSIKAEKTFYNIANAIKNSSKICGDQDVSQYPIPQDLSHIAQYSSLVISDLYSDDYFDKDVVLSFNNVLIKTFDDEFECECFGKLFLNSKGEFTELEITNDINEKIKVKTLDLALSSIKPMDVDEWVAFLNLINKFAKEPINLTKIVKKPMTLSEVGGLFDEDGDFFLVNSEQPGSYELAYLLGYHVEEFPYSKMSRKDVKDIHLRTYFNNKVGV